VVHHLIRVWAYEHLVRVCNYAIDQAKAQANRYQTVTRNGKATALQQVVLDYPTRKEMKWD
jgi:hypothetical protein